MKTEQVNKLQNSTKVNKPRLFPFRFKDLRSSNATYYGKTEPYLKLRSGEHIGLSTLTGNRVA